MKFVKVNSLHLINDLMSEDKTKNNQPHFQATNNNT